MSRSLIVTLLTGFVLAAPAAAQPLFEIELAGGFTFVDVEGVADADGAIAEDWNQPSFRGAARALFGSEGGLRYGAEVGYQSLYWYAVRIPFGSQPIHREYTVTAFSAMGLARLDVGSALVDLGAGLALLDDPAPLISVAVGWEVAERLSVKLRADGIVASQPTLPLGIGISYGFRPSGR